MTVTTPTHAPTSSMLQTPANTSAPTVVSTIPRPTNLRIQGRQTVLRSVRAEWLKIWTLRSTWIICFIAITLTVLFGAGIAAAVGQTDQYQDMAKDAVTAGLSFGQIVIAVLGALIITGEYSSGQIRSSLAAVPHRGRILVSKAVVVSVISFILGSVSVFLSWAISKPFLGEHAGSLTDSHYLGYIWGSGLAFAVITLMTLGISFLLRSTAGAITVVVSLLFVVIVPLQLAAGRWDWANKIIGCLPSTVSTAVSDPFQLSTQWGGEGSQFLTHGQAIAVFIAWAIVPLIAAWIVFSRRDA
ncbi:ABC transporter permease subunit [Actinomyces viscosus]|uniref:ABC-type transport system involved in multi-copper enzyme maturation, permease component n=1 Tax=Actinomyces viscosus TaxID=1656 RepID=A0A448PPB1_ACTVI|nr:ABC transporter permease subunit [Actinomyces viscosus]VEI18353.1 ABC-type transport system involved in multi-copper enzyme maturation, permease component [Actinomyces viscosus]